MEVKHNDKAGPKSSVGNSKAEANPGIQGRLAPEKVGFVFLALSDS